VLFAWMKLSFIFLVIKLKLLPKSRFQYEIINIFLVKLKFISCRITRMIDSITINREVYMQSLDSPILVFTFYYQHNTLHFLIMYNFFIFPIDEKFVIPTHNIIIVVDNDMNGQTIHKSNFIIVE